MKNLQIYRKKLGLTQKQLAKQLGLIQTKLSKLEVGDAELRMQEILKLQEHGLNINWLMTGKGEMLASSPQPPSLTLPFYAIENISVSIEDQSTIQTVENLPIKKHIKADFCTQIRGTDMDPAFFSGDYVSCRYSDWKSFFEWGSVYIICTKHSTLIKIVNKNENPKLITLKSYSNKFEDIDLPIDKITNAYRVVGILFSQREM